MSAWSGGGFDTQRDRFMIWGGGHTHYAGNELYAFDVNTLRWVRLTDPSTNVGGTYSSGYYPDGKPRSRHTYNFLQYVPSMDRFCSFGATAGYPNGTIMGAMVDCFNFSTSQWERKADAPSVGPEGPFTGYDQTTGHVWAHGTGPGTYLTGANPSNNTRDTRPTLLVDVRLHSRPDWRRRKFVGLGEGRCGCGFNNPDASAVFITTTGATSIVGGTSRFRLRSGDRSVRCVGRGLRRILAQHGHARLDPACEDSGTNAHRSHRDRNVWPLSIRPFEKRFRGGECDQRGRVRLQAEFRHGSHCTL
jgi:hypothetical protein